MTLPTDIVTNAWVRNPGDEKAVVNGCTFDVERAAWAVDGCPAEKTERPGRRRGVGRTRRRPGLV